MKKPEIIKFCSFCNDQFIASRLTAKYCSNTCRTKANTQRRENERHETEKAAEQAIVDEEKRKAAEARKIKKAQKDADIAEAKRLADIELIIQAERTAVELIEKKRNINSIISMLRVNAEAKDSQLLADEKRKKNEERIRLEKEMKKAKEHGEMIGKGLVELFKNLSNLSNNTGNTATQPGPVISPTLPPKPEMPSQLVQNTSPTPATKPVRISIAEDILDQLNIF